MNEQWKALFDLTTDRTKTNCAKWDSRKDVFQVSDVIPLWVADMDFRAPEPIISALKSRAEHGIFGYLSSDPRPKDAVIKWLKTRHGLACDRELLIDSPGVVSSLFYCLKALLREGDKVAVQPPVYGPFYSMAEKAKMELYLNPLRLMEDGTWQMDLDQLEEGFRSGVKALMLCSPHNPVGRVWTESELRALAELADKYGAYIFSDEIHADIIMPGFRHTPLITLYPKTAMLFSASKTFGLAGLRQSTILAGDKEMAKRIRETMESMDADGPNIFGLLAQTVAYESCDEWLDQMLLYLDDTRAQVIDEFSKIKGLHLSPLEGTYLMWIDCRKLNLKNDELVRFFAERAGVGLNGGKFFGLAGEGYVRLNIASPRTQVMEGIAGIMKAVNER